MAETTFLQVVVIDIVLCVLMLLAYLCLASRAPQKWFPAWSPQGIASVQSSISGLWTHVISPAMFMPDVEVAERTGVDAVLYLRLLEGAIRHVGVLALLALAVLLPVNLTGKEAHRGVAAADTYNVEQGSPKLYAHACFVVVASLGMYALAAGFRGLARSFAQGVPLELQIGLRTVRILGIPKTETTPDRLQKHLDTVYPGAVEQVNILVELAPLQRLLDKRAGLLSQKQIARNAIDAGEPRPQRCTCCGPLACCGRVDTVEYCDRAIADIDEAIEQQRDQPLKAAGLAVVTFTTVDGASRMISEYSLGGSHPETQEGLHLEVAKWDVARAPEPEDIIYQSEHVGRGQRCVRTVVLNGAILLTIAVLVTPLTVTRSLTNLSEGRLGWCGTLLAEYIPTLVMFLFVWVVVPALLSFASRFEGHHLRSSAAKSFLIKYWVYLFLAAVLLPLCSMSLYALGAYLTSGKASLEESFNRAFADSSGSQFLLYVTSFGLLSTPFELFRVPASAAAMFKHCAVAWGWRSPSKKGAAAIEPFDYPFQYAVVLHIVSVVLFLAILSPLIALFGEVFLILKYYVDRVALLCIHPRSEDTGGRLAGSSVNILAGAVALMQCGAAAFLLVRQSLGPAILCVVTLLSTSIPYALVSCCRQNSSHVGAAAKRNLPPGASYLADNSLDSISWFSELVEDELYRGLSRPTHTVRFTKGCENVTAASPDNPLADEASQEHMDENMYRHPALDVYYDGICAVGKTHV